MLFAGANRKDGDGLPSSMLKKNLRLSKKDLEKFFKQRSRSFFGDFLRLRALLVISTTKWAFVVSSSITKNAVARNLTRRRMAEIAQSFDGKLKKDYHLVFFLKLISKKAPSFIELKNDMIKTLSLCGAL